VEDLLRNSVTEVPRVPAAVGGTPDGGLDIEAVSGILGTGGRVARDASRMSEYDLEREGSGRANGSDGNILSSVDCFVMAVR
jgi:hypothetical protein